MVEVEPFHYYVYSPLPPTKIRLVFVYTYYFGKILASSKFKWILLLVKYLKEHKHVLSIVH